MIPPTREVLSVAYTNASVLGLCYIVHSQPAASVAVYACAWRKKKKITAKKQPPSLWQEMLKRPRLLLKGFYQFCKGYAAGECTGMQHKSTEPGLTLQYRHLLLP